MLTRGALERVLGEEVALQQADQRGDAAGGGNLPPPEIARVRDARERGGAKLGDLVRVRVRVRVRDPNLNPDPITLTLP